MILSMTGFGSAEAELAGQRMTAQIQSVNHRFCEVSVRLPRALQSFETQVRQWVSQHFVRGKIHFQVAWEGREEPGKRVEIDADRARHYVAELRSLKISLGIKGDPDFATIVALPDVFVTTTDELDPDAAERALQALVESAVGDLQMMREHEGKALEDEFRTRLDKIGSLNARAAERCKQRPQELKDRLLERLKPLLEGVDVDPQRLAQEAAILADRLDFTEETMRLGAHVEQFRDLLGNPEAVGRKLNFLLQEMNREANTMGSKANDAEIATLVIEIKDELEKMREQVQNVE